MSDSYSNNTPLSVLDFVERGLSEKDARHRVNQIVFGADVKYDDLGNPIEQGLGSALQQTPQHFEALKLEAQRQAMANKHLTPEAIGAAVAAAMAGQANLTPDMIAAAVTAALAAPRGAPAARPKRKYQRKAKPAQELA